ncbi:MAG: hypothetical protein ACLVG9_03140 [Eubacteriales bacterium]
MIAKSRDILKRDGMEYGVICADEECFVIGRRFYNIEQKCYTTDYTYLEAYSNDEEINTLSDLNFIKI